MIEDIDILLGDLKQTDDPDDYKSDVKKALA